MNPKNSQDLFNKIRSQFSNIRLGDENGAATADPSSAVFFEFEFQEDADTFGSVSISLADGENMKVYYNRNLVNKIDEDSKDEWYAFLKELKDYAVEHQMGFDVRDITKNNLTKQDYENLADTNKTVNTDEMSEELARITKLAGVEKAPVAEGLTGTSKSSFENLNKTKLIIRHKGKVDETVPGARSRQIQSLYIENEDGERFKYPMTHLAGARAMMRHVANGGRPHDEFGQHIVSTSEDIAKLNSFSRYASNKDQLNDNAGDIIEQTKLKLENLRGYMKNLSNQTHYENASKDFKTSEEQILDDETVNKLREKFTMKNLDSRVEDAFPIINKIMSEFEATKEQEQVNELDPGKNFEKKDKETVPTVLPKDAEPIDAPIQAPVDHGAIVQGYLSDPDSKLILRKDDTADKMLKITKFKDKNTMLSSILSDIASRLISTPKGEEDRVANFASRVADEMDQEKSAAFKPSADYIKNKKIAVQLAKRYIDDYKKMQSEPGYTDQVRKDPQEINKFKNIKGQSYGDKGAEYKAPSKETEAFESWVDETMNEYAKMGDYPRDKEIEKKDKENATKLDVTKADKMMNTTAYKRMKAGDERYADKTEGTVKEMGDAETEISDGIFVVQRGDNADGVSDEDPYVVGELYADPELSAEDIQKTLKDYVQSKNLGPKVDFRPDDSGSSVIDGKAYRGEVVMNWLGSKPFEGNQFAQAVNKAKAAGMKAGDKFKVGDQEYTLKDAIEMAGLQLEEFFSEEEMEVPAEAQAEAEAINTELDRIKTLANIA